MGHGAVGQSKFSRFVSRNSYFLNQTPLFLFAIATIFYSLISLAIKVIGPVIYVPLAKSSSVEAQSEAGEAGGSGILAMEFFLVLNQPFTRPGLDW